MNSSILRTFIVVLILSPLAGCSQQSGEPSVAERSTPATSRDAPVVPPTISIQPTEVQLDVPELSNAEPIQTALANNRSTTRTSPAVREDATSKVTPESTLAEIARLKQSVSSTAGAIGAELDQQELLRLHRIVELSQQVIAQTHDQINMLSVFHAAILELAAARLQLALAGDDEQVRLLGEDAETLYRKDATSYAAVETALKVVQYTQTQAQRQAAQESRWATAYARQARLFAERFPNETNRVAIHLVAAGRICDKIGLHDEARNCMGLVEQKFPGSPFADQVENPLRRLRLPGNKLTEFGGSTLDGSFVSIQQFQGRPVIIAFWASNSVIFREDLRIIDEAIQAFGGAAVVLGVNLDRDEPAVHRFLEQTGNTWPHIFYSDPNKRGMDNLVAKYFGVDKVPSYWLIDSEGVVQTVSLRPENLRTHLSKLAFAGTATR